MYIYVAYNFMSRIICTAWNYLVLYSLLPLQYKEYEQIVVEDRIEKEKARRKAEQEAIELRSAIKVIILPFIFYCSYNSWSLLCRWIIFSLFLLSMINRFVVVCIYIPKTFGKLFQIFTEYLPNLNNNMRICIEVQPEMDHKAVEWFD